MGCSSFESVAFGRILRLICPTRCRSASRQRVVERHRMQCRAHRLGPLWAAPQPKSRDFDPLRTKSVDSASKTHESKKRTHHGPTGLSLCGEESYPANRPRCPALSGLTRAPVVSVVAPPRGAVGAPAPVVAVAHLQG